MAVVTAKAVFGVISFIGQFSQTMSRTTMTSIMINGKALIGFMALDASEVH
jgi:hypothetical protein